MTLRALPVKRNCAAFTLIELTVVLIVIAIMSAVIVGEMSGNYQDALLRSAGRQLIGVFNLASSRAISLNRPHRVRFDRMSGRYFIEKHARGDLFIPARDVPEGEGMLDSRIAIRVQDPADVESPETEQQAAPPEPTPGETVSFYPDGTTDGREIELRDRNGYGLALRVSPITARVEILELARQ